MENINKVFDIEECLDIIDYNQIKQTVSSNGDEQVLEDLLRRDYAQNIRVERKNQLVLRDLRVVRKLKQEYGCKCQICGHTFRKDDGEYYCEAHHIVPVAADGTQSPNNVLLLCANHHRMFHYAKERIKVGPINGNCRAIFVDGTKYDMPVLEMDL